MRTFFVMIMDFNLDKSVRVLCSWLPEIPDTAIVLGSGIAPLSEALGNKISLPLSELGLPVPKVSGHSPMIHHGQLDGRNVLMMGGRVHAYEGYIMAQTTLYVRLLAAAGVKNLVLTNAAGAVNTKFRVGDVVCITDHIKLVAESPLAGEVSARFVDLSDVYNADLRAKAATVAVECGIKLQNGVYMYFAGPNYETAAEIKAARVLGADLVGMSTAPEAIMATAEGMKTVAFSVVSNMASGISETPLDHNEIKEAFKGAGPKMHTLLAGLLKII